MTTPTKLAVLDDCTRDAMIIGYAADADEAARVYAAYMAESGVLGDDEEPIRPVFSYRNPHGADFRGISNDEIINGYFEPIF